MARRLIGRDPLTGIETYHDYNAQTDETSIIHVGDSEPVLEDNKRLANDPEYSKDGIKQGWWKYASIPAGVQVKWLIEYGVDVWNKHHGERIGKLLEDPQWKYLKTTSGYHKMKR